MVSHGLNLLSLVATMVEQLSKYLLVICLHFGFFVFVFLLILESFLY